MSKQLYRCDLHYLLYVMAEDDTEARMIATNHAPDSSLRPNFRIVRREDCLDAVPNEHVFTIPYGSQDMKSIKEIFGGIGP